LKKGAEGRVKGRKKGGRKNNTELVGRSFRKAHLIKKWENKRGRREDDEEKGESVHQVAWIDHEIRHGRQEMKRKKGGGVLSIGKE